MPQSPSHDDDEGKQKEIKEAEEALDQNEIDQILNQQPFVEQDQWRPSAGDVKDAAAGNESSENSVEGEEVPAPEDKDAPEEEKNGGSETEFSREEDEEAKQILNKIALEAGIFYVNKTPITQKWIDEKIEELAELPVDIDFFIEDLINNEMSINYDKYIIKEGAKETVDEHADAKNLEEKISSGETDEETAKETPTDDENKDEEETEENRENEDKGKGKKMRQDINDLRAILNTAILESNKDKLAESIKERTGEIAKLVEAENIENNGELKNLIEELLKVLSGEDEKKTDNINKKISEITGLSADEITEIYQIQEEVIAREAEGKVNKGKFWKGLASTAGYIGAAGLIGFASGGMGLIAAGTAKIGFAGLAGFRIAERSYRGKKHAQKVEQEINNIKKSIQENEARKKSLLANFSGEMATRIQGMINKLGEKEAPDDTGDEKETNGARFTSAYEYINSNSNFEKYNEEEKTSLLRAIDALIAVDYSNNKVEKEVVEKNSSWFGRALKKVDDFLTSDKTFFNRMLKGGNTAGQEFKTASIFAAAGIAAREVPVIGEILRGYGGMKLGEMGASFYSRRKDEIVSAEDIKKMREDLAVPKEEEDDELTELTKDFDAVESAELNSLVNKARAQLLDANFRKNFPDEYNKLRVVIDKIEQEKIIEAVNETKAKEEFIEEDWTEESEIFKDINSYLQERDRDVQAELDKRLRKERNKTAAAHLGRVAGMAAGVLSDDLVRGLADMLEHKETAGIGAAGHESVSNGQGSNAGEQSLDVSPDTPESPQPPVEPPAPDILPENKGGLEHPEHEVSKIHRALWYDNDDPSKPVGNEKRFLPGGVQRTGFDKEGDIIFDISKMTPDGSAHGGNNINVPYLLKQDGNGDRLCDKLRLLITVDGDRDSEVIEVPVDTDGKITIPAGSDLAEKLFAKGPNGQAVFKGAFLEIAKVNEGKDGARNVEIIATHVGNKTINEETIKSLLQPKVEEESTPSSAEATEGEKSARPASQSEAGEVRINEDSGQQEKVAKGGGAAESKVEISGKNARVNGVEFEPKDLGLLRINESVHINNVSSQIAGQFKNGEQLFQVENNGQVSYALGTVDDGEFKVIQPDFIGTGNAEAVLDADNKINVESGTWGAKVESYEAELDQMKSYLSGADVKDPFQFMKQAGFDNYDFGRLETLIRNGITNPADAHTALEIAQSSGAKLNQIAEHYYIASPVAKKLGEDNSGLIKNFIDFLPKEKKHEIVINEFFAKNNIDYADKVACNASSSGTKMEVVTYNFLDDSGKTNAFVRIMPDKIEISGDGDVVDGNDHPIGDLGKILADPRGYLEKHEAGISLAESAAAPETNSIGLNSGDILRYPAAGGPVIKIGEAGPDGKINCVFQFGRKEINTELVPKGENIYEYKGEDGSIEALKLEPGKKFSFINDYKGAGGQTNESKQLVDNTIADINSNNFNNQLTEAQKNQLAAELPEMGKEMFGGVIDNSSSRQSALMRLMINPNNTDAREDLLYEQSGDTVLSRLDAVKDVAVNKESGRRLVDIVYQLKGGKEEHLYIGAGKIGNSLNSLENYSMENLDKYLKDIPARIKQ